MWEGTLSEALPPGKNLKLRVIISENSFNSKTRGFLFLGPSP